MHETDIFDRILEMATEFPNTGMSKIFHVGTSLTLNIEFHGIDLRKMFPVTIKPKNATFLQYNLFKEKKLPYPDEHFDFVRIRLMLAFMSEQDFLDILSEVHRILKPMGYIEILDCEYQVHRSGYLTETVLNQQRKSNFL